MSLENIQTIRKNGYVLDYGDIKRSAKEIIEPLDHKFLIPNSVKTSEDKVDYQEITVPARMVCLLSMEVVSSENLSLYFRNKMMEAFPTFEIECKVNEGEGQGVWI